MLLNAVRLDHLSGRAMGFKIRTRKSRIRRQELVHSEKMSIIPNEPFEKMVKGHI